MSNIYGGVSGIIDSEVGSGGRKWNVVGSRGTMEAAGEREHVAAVIVVEEGDIKLFDHIMFFWKAGRGAQGIRIRLQSR